MADPTASLEAHCFFGVRNIIKDMARQGVFKMRGVDSTDRVREEAVVGRFSRAEPGIRVMPGFIVTYLGHERAVNAGENDSDLGKISIFIQFIDKTTNEDHPNANSYFTWMEVMRRWLLDGPLEEPDETLGFVYHTHLSSQMPPAEYDWAVHENMKMSAMLTCFTKTTRTHTKAQA
jgi:hypothetical protein